MGWFDEQGTPDPATTYYVGDVGGAVGVKGDPNADPMTNPATGQPWTEAELMAAVQARRDDTYRAHTFNAGGKDVSTLPSIPSGPYHQTTKGGSLIATDPITPQSMIDPSTGQPWTDAALDAYLATQSAPRYQTMNQGSSAASLGQPAIVRNNTGITGGGITGGQPWTQANGGAGGLVGAQQGGYQPFNEGVMRSILEKYTPDYAGVKRAAEEVDRTFGPGVVKLLDHPTKLDKFQLPNGQVIDTVIGAGGTNPTWTWAPEGAGGGGAGGGGGLMGNGLSPQAQNFFNIAGQSYGAIGPIFGDPMAGRSLTDDPAFKFRLEEGRKALEASAAAKGTLLTGGTLKGLERFAQDYAGNEYQNSYARRASEQANNYNRLLGLAGFASGEQQNQFGRLYQTAGLGLSATNAAQNNASGYANNIANTQIGVGNVQGAATQAGAAANADTIGAIGALAGQYGAQYAGRRTDPNNTGGWIDQGRGLY